MNIEDKNGATVLHRTQVQAPRRSWRTWLIGRPLPTADAPHQTIGKLLGLAIFASDALSSTAYATQEIMIILAAAGAAALGYTFPISIAIVILMVVVTISYEQTIYNYPGGGGAYIVSRDNLGSKAAMVAGAALLTDYVLTVAVSISSGVAQISSAFPDLFPWRVQIGVAMVLLVMLINLRGVKESGTAFAIPSYFFVIMMFITIGVGLFRYFTGTLGTVVNPPEMHSFGEAAMIGPFLILHAFSSGTAAMTGIEAISSGITAFKEPRSRNAGITLLWMIAILGSMFLSISFLVGPIGAVPSEQETVISQLARTVFSDANFLYLLVIAGTSVILFLAANTAFAGFPRLSAIQATDGFLPRQLAFRGSRLVYSRGIVALAFLGAALIVIFQASVTRLMPLYAIGVFLSFTLSQTGMARRWWKVGHLRPGEEVREAGSVLRYDPRWRGKMILNGIGALLTLVVVFVFAITKFVDGAWVVILVIPALVLLFSRINAHYRRLAEQLSLEDYGAPPRIVRHRVLLPLGGVHRGTLRALSYARRLSDDITAVHVSIDPEETERLQEKWLDWGDGVRLVILESPYRTFLEPLLEYIDTIDATRQPNEVITIVVPEFVPRHFWANLLHTQTALTLRWALLFRRGIVITSVPYQVD